MIAGIDEVGRGCVCGPVIAAVVILHPENAIAGLTDSKKLSEKKRLLLAHQIKQQALDWALGRAEASEIDRINILQASLLAMQRAFHQLTVKPDKVLVDGKFCPQVQCPSEAIIQGDLKVAEISAASIMAKVARDEEMKFLHRLYPEYQLNTHKGYPTRQHLSALQQFGVTAFHRTTFAPIKKLLHSQNSL